jgi:F-type H+-transporting ATPase subunit delta
MPTSVVAKRYAKALFQLAVEQNVLDAVQADAEHLAGLLAHSEELAKITGPYLITIEGRKKNLRALFEGRMHPLLLRFLLFLSDKRRFEAIIDILEEFRALCDERKNILNIRIVSAQPLSQGQVDEISKRMASRFTKTIRAAAKVDPSLLGGFQVHVGDVVYDYSIDHLLDTLHRKLITA